MKTMTTLPLLLVALACEGEIATSPDTEGTPQVLVDIRLRSDTALFRSLGQSSDAWARPLNQWGSVFTGRTLEWEWTSRDPSVAVVTGNGVHGLVTSVGNGTTSILVRAGDISSEFEVSVYQEPYGVSVTPSTVQLFLDPPTHTTGPTTQLAATVTDRGGQACSAWWCAVTWASADPEIAGIDTSGVVEPRASGSTEVHAVVRGPCVDLFGCWYVADTASVSVSPR